MRVFKYPRIMRIMGGAKVRKKEEDIAIALCAAFQSKHITYNVPSKTYYINIDTCCCCGKQLFVACTDNIELLWGCRSVAEGEEMCEFWDDDNYECMHTSNCPINNDEFKQRRSHFAEALALSFVTLFKRFGKASFILTDEEEEIIAAINYCVTHSKNLNLIIYAEALYTRAEYTITFEGATIKNMIFLHLRRAISKGMVLLNDITSIDIYPIARAIIPRLLRPYVKKLRFHKFVSMLKHRKNFNMYSALHKKGDPYLRISAKSISQWIKECNAVMKGVE